MTAILFILLGCILALFIYLKTRDILHPLIIGSSLWFFAVSLSSIESFFDSAIQVPLSTTTLVNVFCAGLFFCLSFVFSRKINKDIFNFQLCYFSVYYRGLFNLLVFLVLLTFVIRFNSVLFHPPLIYGVGSDLKILVPDAPAILNFIDISTPYLALLAVFEVKYSCNIDRTRKVGLILYVLFTIISALVYKISRGEFLVFMLGFFYIILIARKKMFNYKIFKGVLFSILALMLFGSLRISDDSRVSTQFGSGSLNILFSQIYTYVAMNYQNLNLLVNSNFELTYFWGGLKFFLKPFFANYYDSNYVGFTDFETSFFNAKTYIYYFYNDLGIVGVICYSFIIGFILQLIYNKAVLNIKYFVLLACFMKAVIFMFFGNYFFGEFVLTIPYLIVLFMLLLVRTMDSRATDRNK